MNGVQILSAIFDVHWAVVSQCSGRSKPPLLKLVPRFFATCSLDRFLARDLEAGAVSVRLHYGGPQGTKPKAEVVADILAAIKARRA